MIFNCHLNCGYQIICYPFEYYEIRNYPTYFSCFLHSVHLYLHGILSFSCSKKKSTLSTYPLAISFFTQSSILIEDVYIVNSFEYTVLDVIFPHILHFLQYRHLYKYHFRNLFCHSISQFPHIGGNTFL